VFRINKKNSKNGCQIIWKFIQGRIKIFLHGQERNINKTFLIFGTLKKSLAKNVDPDHWVW